MEKKQTAVQYYATMAENIKYKYSLNIINTIEYYEELLDTLNKALEMEKEQMLEFGSKVTERWGMCKVEQNFIEDEFNKIYKSK